MSDEMPTNGGNAPVHTIRKHSLKVSIWRNETRAGPMYNTTLIRTFRDGEEFKDTGSLGFDDLANAAKLLLDAESWITWRMLRDKDAGEKASSGSPSSKPANGEPDTAQPERRPQRRQRSTAK